MFFLPDRNWGHCFYLQINPETIPWAEKITPLTAPSDVMQILCDTCKMARQHMLVTLKKRWGFHHLCWWTVVSSWYPSVKYLLSSLRHGWLGHLRPLIVKAGHNNGCSIWRFCICEDFNASTFIIVVSCRWFGQLHHWGLSLYLILIF